MSCVLLPEDKIYQAHPLGIFEYTAIIPAGDDGTFLWDARLLCNVGDMRAGESVFVGLLPNQGILRVYQRRHKDDEEDEAKKKKTEHTLVHADLYLKASLTPDFRCATATPPSKKKKTKAKDQDQDQDQDRDQDRGAAKTKKKKS